MATQRRAQAGRYVHVDAVVEAHGRMLDPLPVGRRRVETRSGHGIHVLEIEEGAPALFFHAPSARGPAGRRGLERGLDGERGTGPATSDRGPDE